MEYNPGRNVTGFSLLVIFWNARPLLEGWWDLLQRPKCYSLAPMWVPQPASVKEVREAEKEGSTESFQPASRPQGQRAAEPLTRLELWVTTA
jgi:hypothetical protein